MVTSRYVSENTLNCSARRRPSIAAQVWWICSKISGKRTSNLDRRESTMTMRSNSISSFLPSTIVWCTGYFHTAIMKDIGYQIQSGYLDRNCMFVSIRSCGLLFYAQEFGGLRVNRQYNRWFHLLLQHDQSPRALHHRSLFVQVLTVVTDLPDDLFV